MDIQTWFNGMSAQWQRQRAATQMTLGRMIETLERMPPGNKVARLCCPASYRGYYEDLAFELRDEKTTAGELLAVCKDAMGKVFYGYKGGDFVMGALTPLWIAEYGDLGVKLMALLPNGEIETAEDE